MQPLVHKLDRIEDLVSTHVEPASAFGSLGELTAPNPFDHYDSCSLRPPPSPLPPHPPLE